MKRIMIVFFGSVLGLYLSRQLVDYLAPMGTVTSGSNTPTIPTVNTMLPPTANSGSMNGGSVLVDGWGDDGDYTVTEDVVDD